jgi:hypothetical protein
LRFGKRESVGFGHGGMQDFAGLDLNSTMAGPLNARGAAASAADDRHHSPMAKNPRSALAIVFFNRSRRQARQRGLSIRIGL